MLLVLYSSHIKTHGSVSCGPRSRRTTPVSILTGRTKTSFSHLCISVITYPIGTKLLHSCPPARGVYIPNLKEIAPAISEIRAAKVSFCIKFGINPMNGSGVMTNYLRKTRSICCHAYRVNRFME